MEQFKINVEIGLIELLTSKSDFNTVNRGDLLVFEIRTFHTAKRRKSADRKIAQGAARRVSAHWGKSTNCAPLGAPGSLGVAVSFFASRVWRKLSRTLSISRLNGCLVILPPAQGA